MSALVGAVDLDKLFIGADNPVFLHDLYTLRQDWELARMTEKERAEVVFHFQCSLFDDLDIALEDIFYRTF